MLHLIQCLSPEKLGGSEQKEVLFKSQNFPLINKITTLQMRLSYKPLFQQFTHWFRGLTSALAQGVGRDASEQLDMPGGVLFHPGTI